MRSGSPDRTQHKDVPELVRESLALITSLCDTPPSIEELAWRAATTLARRDDAQMPPLATEVVDAVGLAMIDSWIRALPFQ